MTKREVIWLLIRLAGLYFLVRGLVMALGALNILLLPLAALAPPDADLQGPLMGAV